MDNITIIIATRNRAGKLRRCLASIPLEPWIKVIVGCDGDPGMAVALLVSKSPYRPVDRVISSRGHIGSIAMRNLMAPMAGDGLLQLCDDMDVQPGAIEKALDSFNRHFPDDDGVLGIHQEGINSYHPTGVFLMGQRFLQRYPGKRILCPDYRHYGAQEIHRLADSLGRFAFEPEAAVYHHHPGAHKDQVDQTHQESQMCKEQDQVLSLERQRGCKIWGQPESSKTKGVKKPPLDRAIKPEETETR
jgi:hypothetical protein